MDSYNLFMVAARLQCRTCGIAFYGRADARYCCAACRQKAYRKRTVRRTAMEIARTPELGNTAAQVRENLERARAARASASGVRHAAAETRATVRKATKSR